MLTIASTHKSKSVFFLTLWLMITFIFNNITLPGLLGKNEQLIELLVWGGVLVLLYFKLSKPYDIGSKEERSRVVIWALGGVIAYIIIQLAAGFLLGFGKSPYDRSIRGVIYNVITMGLPLVGMECVRAYIMKSTGKNVKKTFMVALSLLMVLITVRISTFEQFTSGKAFIIYLASNFMPLFCQSLLATYLVTYSGAKASISYLGLTKLFTILFPILPNLNWLATGVIGMAIPGITLAIISNNYEILTGKQKPDQEEGSLWSFIVTAIIAVGIIWFVVGVFPVYPSVIVTGSMQPVIKAGDVVLLDRIDDMEELNALEVGDVIQYEKDNILIVHRITEIENIDNVTYYHTKGDHNSSEDFNLVEQQQVKGKLVKVVPKIGLPSLLLKKQDTSVMNEVEF